MTKIYNFFYLLNISENFRLMLTDGNYLRDDMTFWYFYIEYLVQSQLGVLEIKIPSPLFTRPHHPERIGGSHKTNCRLARCL